MKRFGLLAGLVIVLMSAQPAQAQLLRRLFGGRERQVQVQQQQCYYQPVQYTQAVQYQVVAAVPLTTVPLAVDLQSYVYSVNASAFQNFREYQNQRGEQQNPDGNPVAARSAVVSGTTPSGADILRRSCIQCHQQGRAPKAGFAMFDESGQLASNLPLQEMLSRMTSDDPGERMPPKSQLANHDILAVMRMAVDGVPARPVQTANNDSRPANPFD